MGLIDADKAIGRYYAEWEKQDISDGAQDRDWLKQCIDEAPAIDAVPVVRCKDCLYAFDKYGHIECSHGVCYRNTYNEPDMFCSYGKRKEANT